MQKISRLEKIKFVDGYWKIKSEIVFAIKHGLSHIAGVNPLISALVSKLLGSHDPQKIKLLSTRGYF
jgi:hypothetical protein